jgi:osmoprotectant transport system ATP-binding protein
MIELRQVTRRHGATLAVDALSLTAPAGQIIVLLGPSGCGKSTTLRMINRLLDPDSGTIRLNGQDIAGQDPIALRRRIGYAIQDVGLFPHWSVARNVAAVPSMLGWQAGRIAARVNELLNLVGLPPEQFAGRRPALLSGGQAQRVGVARALAADPEWLLMDEPFGALDPITRRDLQAAFRRIQRQTGKTVVLVTHCLAWWRKPARVFRPPPCWHCWCRSPVSARGPRCWRCSSTACCPLPKTCRRV